MNIAIDARGANIYKGTGIGTYTFNILKNILDIDKSNSYTLFWSGEDYEKIKTENTNVILASTKSRRFFEQYYFPKSIKKSNIDLFHIPQNGIGLSSNLKCKKVVTIHDLIPYIMPETVGKGYLSKFLEEMPRIVREADGIITVSEWSKRDIIRFFPDSKDKVFVTPLAADSKYKPIDKNICRDILSKKYNITLPYILYIGGFSPRKNVVSLVDAFSGIFKDLSTKHNLVIVGFNKDDYTTLAKICSVNSISSNVIFTGFVPEEDLPVLYNGSEAFVYPSLYEGFGLPPLEAMSCGVPVITSNLTSIPEVVKDGGMLIDPNDAENLKAVLIELLNNDNLKKHYREKGLKRASAFSWHNTAFNTLKIYKSIFDLN